MDEEKRKPRGFAAISADRLKEIQKKAALGRARSGRCHRFNSRTGSAAGQIGGRRLVERYGNDYMKALRNKQKEKKP